MNKIKIILPALLLAFLSACSTLTQDIEIETESDPKANLKAYKTYTWVGAGEFLNDPEMHWHPPKVQVAEEIQFLIDRELRKKGITLANTANADLGVAFFLGVDMAAKRFKKSPNSKFEKLTNVPEGALVVALIDANSGYVIWMGEAVAEYKANQYTNEEIRERLDYAVTEMFKSY